MKGDVNFLKQLVESLEDAVNKLDEAVKEKDVKSSEKFKRFILEVHNKINEELS